MSTSCFSPQAGDIVSVNLPHYLRPGIPGDEPRLALVLGCEIDPDLDRIEGVYVCRLSERTEKVRAWDCSLGERDFEPGSALSGDFVLRTPRIDLIPVDAAWMGAEPKIHGRLKTSGWDTVAGKLEQGQNSHFYTPSLGPREKLPHTLITTGMQANAFFVSFDHAALARACTDQAEAEQRPASAFEEQFRKATRQADIQCRQKGREIHELFLAARRGGVDARPSP